MKVFDFSEAFASFSFKAGDSGSSSVVSVGSPSTSGTTGSTSLGSATDVGSISALGSSAVDGSVGLSSDGCSGYCSGLEGSTGASGFEAGFEAVGAGAWTVFLGAGVEAPFSCISPFFYLAHPPIGGGTKSSAISFSR